MTQTLDLNKMGLAPMSDFEMQEIDGGIWAELALIGVGLLVNAVYDLGKAYGAKLYHEEN